MRTEPKERNLVVTRVFEAPLEQVWGAWLDPEMVRQWWRPTGFTCPVADMDFREGGTSLVCMPTPSEFGGQDMYNTWSYKKIGPHESFEYIFRFTDEDRRMVDPVDMGLAAGIPKEGRHVLSFKGLGKGKTEMTVTEHGYTSDQAHDLSRAGMEQCLDKMAGIFAKA